LRCGLSLRGMLYIRDANETGSYFGLNGFRAGCYAREGSGLRSDNRASGASGHASCLSRRDLRPQPPSQLRYASVLDKPLKFLHREVHQPSLDRELGDSTQPRTGQNTPVQVENRVFSTRRQGRLVEGDFNNNGDFINKVLVARTRPIWFASRTTELEGSEGQ
jgi:hypothetical protein